MNTTRSSLLVRLRTKEDSAAWSRFARIYTPLVHRWISQLGVEANQVNDLVQEVFVTLLAKASSLSQRPPTKFRAWLRTVTINKCRDHFRQLARKSEPTFSPELEAAIADPAAILTKQEYRRILR